jgi:hypothetical protein
MLKVSEEVAALRRESNRMLHQELLQGAALKSQAAMAPRSTTPRRSFSSQSAIIRRRTTSSFMPRALRPNEAFASRPDL